MKNLTNKRIIVGVTGGIAAYKSAELVRRLKEAGAEVRVVMTQAAKEFITPLTMQAVSGNPVHDSLLDSTAEAAMGHIQLARWADVIVIAPASADFIARLAHGHAGDLLSTLCLAASSVVVVAPAMNQQMWQDSITQENVKRLLTHGFQVAGPEIGAQACGDFGPGRMLEVPELISFIVKLFPSQLLSGKRVLITAGPTQEAIDPVRCLTNHSSGKMGYAMAEAAEAAGADVVLVSGPVHLPTPNRVRKIPVISAVEMHQAVMLEIPQCDIFIATAAVADYRCSSVAEHKISKAEKELVLHLVLNPDILAEAAALPDAPFTVGFAAQTHELLIHAQRKLRDKRIDMIAANLVGTVGVGFGSDENALTVLWKDGHAELPLMSKNQLARKLIKLIAERYDAKYPG